MGLCRQLSHSPVGVSWDPRGRYLAVMTTDRKLFLINAAKGTILKTISSVQLPAVDGGKLKVEPKVLNLAVQCIL